MSDYFFVTPDHYASTQSRVQELLLPHWDAVIGSFLIPIGAALLMGGLEGLLKPLGWPQRLVETGCDLCILGVGVGAGVFGAPERLKKLGVEVVFLATFAL